MAQLDAVWALRWRKLKNIYFEEECSCKNKFSRYTAVLCNVQLRCMPKLELSPLRALPNYIVKVAVALHISLQTQQSQSFCAAVFVIAAIEMDLKWVLSKEMVKNIPNWINLEGEGKRVERDSKLTFVFHTGNIHLTNSYQLLSLFIDFVLLRMVTQWPCISRLVVYYDDFIEQQVKEKEGTA